MAASNTPSPPGAWLAKPSSVAETKITASVMKPMIRLVRHQHVHGERAEREIDDADRDLQQRQRPARQRDLQPSRPITRGLTPDPNDIEPPARASMTIARMRLSQSGSWSIALAACGAYSDPEAEHGGIAEPEGQAGDEADLRDLDGARSPGGIDAIAHRAAGEDAGADIVTDRIAGEAGERGAAVRHVRRGRSCAARTDRRMSA